MVRKALSDSGRAPEKFPKSVRQRLDRKGADMAKFTSVVAVATLALTLSACSGGNGGSSSTNTNANPDDGTQLTMWVRSATDQFSKRLVDAYNSSHKNHVALTII